MRSLSSSLVVLSLFAGVSLGCAEVAHDPAERHNVPLDQRTATGSSTDDGKTTMNVHGTISGEGNGSLEQGLAGPGILGAAKNVNVSALGEKGELTQVAKADVNADGTFDLAVAKEDSPTGVFIVEVTDLANVVIGSAVLNGAPTFFKGFLFDIPVDTLTSLKTQVFMKMAKGDVPGVQNYLNVVNTFLDGELSATIATTGAFASDISEIVGATSDAIIAAENVLVSSLQSIGIPIDISLLQGAQVAVVSGFRKAVDTVNRTFVTESKSLLASLEAAASKAAVPIDDAIYNAIVNSGGTFSSTMKTALPTTSSNTNVNFAVSKSIFKVQTELTTSAIQKDFQSMGMGSSIMDTVNSASTTYNNQVLGAKSLADLEAAKGQFRTVLLGKSDAPQNGILQLITGAIANLTAIINEVTGLTAPLTKNLTAALSAAPFNSLNVGQALTQFDTGAKGVSTSLMKGMGEGEANVVAKALRYVDKTIPQ